MLINKDDFGQLNGFNVCMANSMLFFINSLNCIAKNIFYQKRTILFLYMIDTAFLS